MSRPRIISLTAIAVAIGAMMLIFDASIYKAALAVCGAAVVLRLGYAMIGGLAEPVPEPLEAGLLRKVKLVYRCDICGAEVKMTAAASEDPEPPRHCLEDMILVTPIE